MTNLPVLWPIQVRSHSFGAEDETTFVMTEEKRQTDNAPIDATQQRRNHSPHETSSQTTHPTVTLIPARDTVLQCGCLSRQWLEWSKAICLPKLENPLRINGTIHSRQEMLSSRSDSCRHAPSLRSLTFDPCLCFSGSFTSLDRCANRQRRRLLFSRTSI